MLVSTSAEEFDHTRAGSTSLRGAAFAADLGRFAVAWQCGPERGFDTDRDIACVLDAGTPASRSAMSAGCVSLAR